MWSQYYQASLSQLLRKSILLLCSENVPFEDKLEIDGIICISTATAEKQIVVKVHEVVENLRERASDVSLIPSSECSIKSGSTEQEDEEIFTIESQDGQRSTDGYASVDSTESSPCEISVAVENGTSVEYTVSAGAGLQRSPNHSEPIEEDMDTNTPSLSKRLPCRDIFPLRRVQKQIQREREMPGREKEHDENSSKGSSSDSIMSGIHRGDYLCRLCGTRCSNFSSLSAHNYDAHCRFTCRQCLNTFSMMCNLKRHERLHMGRKQYSCGQCGKGFSRNSDLRIHSLKLHRHPARSTMHYKHQYHGLNELPQPGKRTKSGGLGDILSKLARKQLQNLKEREKMLDIEPRPGAPPRDPPVQVIQPKYEMQMQNEPNENCIDLSQTGKFANNDVVDIVPSIKEPTVIPTPQLTPVFTRSILKPPVHMNSILKEPNNIVQIYPTSNNSSGGHMEETAVAKKMTYSEAPVSRESNGSNAGQPYDTSTVHGHGLSFGRIVFPDQTSAIKTEPPEERSVPELELGLTSLPFLTYTGRKLSVGDSQAVESLMQTQAICTSPTPTVIAPARSRSSSPLRSRTPPGTTRATSPRTSSSHDEQPDSPALISLDRRYWCHLCKTHWENFSSYEQHHVSQHLRYPCQFCDQTFSNKNNRSRHIRSHTGQKEHICTDCGKSFSRSDTLKEHQIIHTDGYLGDQCDYCHVIIKKKAELLGHIKKCSQRQRGRHSASASPSSYSD